MKKDLFNSKLITLDKKHNELIKKYENDEKILIPKYQEEIQKLEKLLTKKISKNNKKNLSTESIEEKIEILKNKITYLQKEKSEYFLENAKYLFYYFEEKKNINNDFENELNINNDKQIPTDIDNKKNIINTLFNISNTNTNKLEKIPAINNKNSQHNDFNKNQNFNINENDENENYDNENYDNENDLNVNDLNINDYYENDDNENDLNENDVNKYNKNNLNYKLNSFTSINSRDIIDRYFNNIDTNYINFSKYTYQNDKCKNCKTGEIIYVESEGVCICNNCSISSKYLIENDKPSYKEPPKELCFYAYKRINHLREILAQFQAKESTNIPDNVLENIKNQIKKERILLKDLTNKKTKEILKNLGYNKYYEHIPFIKDKLGIKPPIMSSELEETLCNLFIEIQKPYSKYCPKERVNFLNYYFTLYKLCELLNEKKFLPYFPMLKDREKRIEQDQIWKKICDELDWEFIPTP